MTNDDYELVEVRLPEDWADYHSIRRAVLFEARGNFNYDPNDADEYLSQNQPLLLKFVAALSERPALTDWTPRQERSA